MERSNPNSEFRSSITAIPSAPELPVPPIGILPSSSKRIPTSLSWGKSLDNSLWAILATLFSSGKSQFSDGVFILS